MQTTREKEVTATTTPTMSEELLVRYQHFRNVLISGGWREETGRRFESAPGGPGHHPITSGPGVARLRRPDAGCAVDPPAVKAFGS
ncbi:hypothetical protein EVAR_86083_1 [Eumeta japonica]|uniref:Uncharacterized protein n=1 Tax=Eumeta variegata TaxID=151549 RepID=A0A4C1V0I7_EUMVA|nr:hypothetical protein EVAR_86083_1 [Eumeta japonica]